MKRLILPVGSILILAFIHLFFFAQSVSLKYELTDLKMKFMEIYKKNRYLSSALARLESLQLIEDQATKKLDMIYPENINYIVLSGEAK